jgi:hypothetical protein
MCSMPVQMVRYWGGGGGVKTREKGKCALGLNDFNNLVLPGRFFEPFRPRLHSKVVKTANMIRNFFKKAIWASKNTC